MEHHAPQLSSGRRTDGSPARIWPRAGAAGIGRPDQRVESLFDAFDACQRFRDRVARAQAADLGAHLGMGHGGRGLDRAAGQAYRAPPDGRQDRDRQQAGDAKPESHIHRRFNQDGSPTSTPGRAACSGTGRSHGAGTRRGSIWPQPPVLLTLMPATSSVLVASGPVYGPDQCPGSGLRLDRIFRSDHSNCISDQSVRRRCLRETVSRDGGSGSPRAA